MFGVVGQPHINGGANLKLLPTWSSCRGRPGRMILPRCSLLNTENQPFAEQIRNAVCMAIACPASRPSSPGIIARIRGHRGGYPTTRAPHTPGTDRSNWPNWWPPAMRLTSEFQYPARDREGGFRPRRARPRAGRAVPRQNRLRPRSSDPVKHLVLLLQHPDTFAELPQFSGLHCRGPASISARLSQFRNQPSAIPKSSAICLIVAPASRPRTTATTSSRHSRIGPSA